MIDGWSRNGPGRIELTVPERGGSEAFCFDAREDVDVAKGFAR
jgi:hypothetical protein